jgi:hypothetical protein
VKLTLRKIGGVTGAAGAATHTLDLDGLPAAQRAKALARVAAARLGSQPNRLFLPHPRPWDFRYVLDVEPGESQPGVDAEPHHLELHLDAADPHLRALVEWLEEVANPG